MKVEIWSDVVCPWCYVGKRRFEAALEEFDHAEEVEVVWRSFELDPGARSDVPGAERAAYAERLASKYGTDVAGGQQMIDTMTQAAAAEGLALDFDRAVAANTFDAHQVIHLAAERGIQDQVKERLLRGYFTEGEPVGDRETLVRLGSEAGLDADEVRAVVADQRYAEAVRHEETEAQGLGISGVPFFVVDRKYGVSGAQPPALLKQLLDKAWSERHPLTMVGADLAADTQSGDAACGPDGCAV